MKGFEPSYYLDPIPFYKPGKISDQIAECKGNDHEEYKVKSQLLFAEQSERRSQPKEMEREKNP